MALWWQTIPFSTLIVMSIALLVDVIILLVTRRFMRPFSHQLRLLRREEGELIRELKKAMQQGQDESKLKRKRERLQQIRLMITKITLKPQIKLFLIFPVVFFVFLFVIIPQLYPPDLSVAHLPFHLYLWGMTISGKVTELNFIWWYSICTLAFNFPLSRAFGLHRMR